MTILAGDIGGTSSRLALFEGDAIVAEKTYASREFESFEAVLATFVTAHRAPIERACFAIAGPVRDGACRTTNLPWPLVDERAIRGALAIDRVRLINDFAAQTLGVTQLSGDGFLTLLDGEPDPRAPIAVIGAGTGLGAALALRGEDGSNGAAGAVTVLPGEGGHADFAPVDERQIAVLRALQTLLGDRVTYERVVSGPGIENVYRALSFAGIAAQSAAIAAEINGADDASAVISQHAIAGDDPLCVATMEVFVEVFAQEAGNMALRTLALGGVYLAGGIASKILPLLQTGRFESRFRSKSPHESLLANIPVRVVTDRHLGLRGAAVGARQLR